MEFEVVVLVAVVQWVVGSFVEVAVVVGDVGVVGLCSRSLKIVAGFLRAAGMMRFLLVECWKELVWLGEIV